MTNYVAAAYSKKVKPALDHAKSQCAILRTGHLPLTEKNLEEFNFQYSRLHWRDITGFELVEVESAPNSNELNFSHALFITLSDYAKSISDEAHPISNKYLESKPIPQSERDLEAPTSDHWDEWEKAVSIVLETARTSIGWKDVSKMVSQAFEAAKHSAAEDRNKAKTLGMNDAEKHKGGHTLPRTRDD